MIEARYPNRRSKNALWDNMVPEGCSISSGQVLSRKGSSIRQRTGSNAIELEVDLSRSDKMNKQRKTLSGSPIDFSIPHFFESHANCLSHSDIMQKLRQVQPGDSTYTTQARQRVDTEPDQMQDQEQRTIFAQHHFEDEENFVSMNDYSDLMIPYDQQRLFGGLPHFSQPASTVARQDPPPAQLPFSLKKNQELFYGQNTNFSKNTQRMYDHDDSKIQSQKVFEQIEGQQQPFSKLYDLKRKYLNKNGIATYKDQPDSQREARRSTSHNARPQTLVDPKKRLERFSKISPQKHTAGTQLLNNRLNTKHNKGHSPFKECDAPVAPKPKVSAPGTKRPSQGPLRSNLRNILKSNFQENQVKVKELTQQQVEAENEKEKIRKEITELQFIPVELQQMDMYVIGKALGQGATAEVKMAKHRVLDLNVAIKIYDRKKMSSQSQRNLQREVEILSKMVHPNIIRLYHVVENEKNINLVMEYTSPTCLNTFMRGRPFKRINEDEAKVIFRQIVDAIAYIHQFNILHRDMKLENVLIDYATRKVKLIDFGYSVEIDPSLRTSTSCGTPSYMSPEIVKKQSYAFGADVWACGVILFKLLTGVFPFRGNSEKDLFRKITIGKIEYPSFLSQGSRNLMGWMMRVDQNDRPSIFEVTNRLKYSQVASHGWLELN